VSAPLQDKVLILTGAGGGQGRIAARVFAQAGARLVLTDNDEKALAELQVNAPPGALCLQHDIRRREDWDGVAARSLATFGRIDVLINNAAIAGRDQVESLTPEALHRYLDVNVIGALNGMQAVLPAMREAGGGAIVNICSISALRAFPGLAGYGISKWGLRGLSRYAAQEFAASKVRVNLILPGAVTVSMIRDEVAAPGKASVADQVPLRRLASPEEIAHAALFLASDAAGYVTGSELVVDGGLVV
jgi:3alpha(or 20beta)-hydroxysteroid dehydrogenase